MDAVSEAGLVAALKSGDDRAAENLIRSHAPALLAVAARIVGDRAIAEDCVQEAFINALKNIGTFEGRSTLRSWLHRIVVNQALMCLRSRKARSERPIADMQPEFDREACRIEQPWHRLATPEEVFEQKDRRAMVLAKIEELPESYRIVLNLRDIEEMTTREVAGLLDETEANIRVRLHRARAALKNLLEPVLRGEV